MKTVFILMFFCLLTAIKARSQNRLDEARFQNLITKSFDDVFSSWKMDKIGEYYTSDFLILEHGLVWNMDSLTNLLRQRNASGKPFKRINTIQVIDFDSDGNTAWGSYYNTATISREGKPERVVKWLESVVLVRQNDQWKIKLLHSTAMD